MRSIKILTLGIAVIAVGTQFLTGCGSEVNSKNMEQLYADNGIPVRTEIVQSTVFSKSYEYNAVISGVKESSAFTSLSDKVESIKYKIGDYVEKDAVVLTFPSDNPKAQYYQAKLAYENAKSSFERMKSFYETGGISRQQFDNAETSFKVAEADWNSIKQSINVKAPISGVLTRLNVRETENVNKDQELFTIAQIDKVKARIWVADSDIEKIRNGQSATAEWNGININGQVIQVDLSMNQSKKAFAVDIVFDNKDKKMRTGVTAKVKVETYRKEGSIFIERKNIIKENTNRYVYLNVDGLAKRQSIETGQTSGIDIEIVNGLTSGDELIVEGQMLLTDNKKLNLITD